MSVYKGFLLAVLLFLLAGSSNGVQHVSAQRVSTVVIDDFESYRAGEWPSRWKYVAKDGKTVPMEQVMNDNERFYIVKENGRQFVRVYTHGRAQRITMTNGDTFDWNLQEHPRLRWEWRAKRLPEGANEREKNDTGGAVYVTFGTDWLGRPKSIKYTYSSALPTGTVVSFGNLKVIVAGSAVTGHGRWERVERNIVDDYRRVFGGEPPEQPLSITLWGDSDDTKSVGEVDFDNLALLPPETPDQVSSK